MALTDTGIKGMKTTSQNYKAFDSKGLFIEVRKSGKKIFRFKYRYNDKHKLLTIGHYPEVSLKRARELHQGALKQLSEGIDPGQVKKINKEIKKNTFKVLAQEWFETNKDKWTQDHANTVWRRLEANVLPWLKDRPIREINSRELLEILRRIESRGAVETAHRINQIISQIFVYTIACGLAENNPASNLSKALKPVSKRSLPAITKPERIKELLKAIDAFQGSFIVYCALKLAPLVFLRPGELRKGEWEEIDWNNKLWVIPAHRMKKRRDHLVPLSRQAVSILEEIHPLTSKSSKYIFPAVRSPSRPMSEGTLNAALLRLGFSKEEHSPHGFRSTASTNLHELGWDSKLIEVQLAHVDQNQVRGIYNRAEYLAERTRMMQGWADYLDALKSGAKVLPFQQNNN